MSINLTTEDFLEGSRAIMIIGGKEALALNYFSSYFWNTIENDFPVIRNLLIEYFLNEQKSLSLPDRIRVLFSVDPIKSLIVKYNFKGFRTAL